MFSLTHICFYTTNLERMIDFYTNLFSSKTVYSFKNNDNEVYGVFIEIGNKTFIEIFNSKLPISHQPNQNFQHFSIETDNLEQTIFHLKSLNIKSEVTIGKSDKTKQIHIKDPDLNKIEIQYFDNKSLMKDHSIFFNNHRN